MPGLVPKAVGYGKYHDGRSQVYFFLGDFRDIDFHADLDQVRLISQVAELHRKGQSPNGMFGFPVSTACGKIEQTARWETSWAECFSHQLKSVIDCDNELKESWPDYDAACQQLIDVVIPQLLGILQSEGRRIPPTLLHGDLWDQNIGLDVETDKPIVFDPGSTYAHNEMEFGTLRCRWSDRFDLSVWMKLYQGHIEPSDPREQWDDRNRLYSIYPYIIHSAGHGANQSRQR